jgi:hypothetical protein
MHPRLSSGLGCFLTKRGNAFNSMLKGVIFQELHATGADIMQLISFVHVFYAFEYLLIYNHYNHEGKC